MEVNYEKKLLVILAVLLLVGVLAFTLAACDPDDPGNEGQDNKVTVTFVHGDTTIRTEEVDKGSAATAFEDYVPEIDGYDFLGWYAAPSLMIPFDFDTVVFNENTTISPRRRAPINPLITEHGISRVPAKANCSLRASGARTSRAMMRKRRLSSSWKGGGQGQRVQHHAGSL